MNQKKKILFAITKGNWGGAQRYVFDLATNLPDDRFEVVVACGEGNRLVTELQSKNIRVIRLDSLQRNMSTTKDILAFWNFYRTLRTERPDVIHLNSSKIGGIGALTGRIAGIKNIIFTGHGWAWNEDRSFVSRSLITVAHWLTIVLAHKTIAVSAKIRNEIIRLPFVPTSKIFVIHNGVSDTEYAERFSARAVLKGEVSEKFWIGTISELHHNKGLDILINSFAEISKSQNDATLMIIGDGEERKSLTTLIDSLGLSKKVHLVGFVKDARKYLKAFDVFVLASRTEAFPYVPLEAGLAQLPVVATRVGGVPEVISNGKNGLLVNKEDTKNLSIAIRKLLQDSTLAATLGHNLRKTVEENYSINSMVQKTIAIYN